MILRRETNIYDDEAVAKSIASVEKKVTATYGTCSTAADTVAKVVTLADFTLFKGAQISVYFTNENKASAPTLNVNGTGAKAIWARGEEITNVYYWSAKSTHTFTYDGAHWVMENAESQEEVFNRLTNGLANQGVYLSEGNLYVNASMIRSGTISADYIYGGSLKLGGVNGGVGGDGLLDVYNERGGRIVRLDKTGATITSGTLNIGNGNFIVDSDGMITAETGYIGEILITDGSLYSNNADENTYFAIGDGFIEDHTRRTNTDDKYREVGFQNGMLFFENAERSFPSVSPPFGNIYGSFISTKATYSGNDTDIYYGRISDILEFDGHDGLVFGTCRSSSNIENNTAQVVLGYYRLSVADNTYFLKNMTVKGTKSRVVETNYYGDRSLYCYETPSPLFGDVGEGTISEDGKCYVWIDSIFAETVSLSQYQVFLQKYGNGDCWVSQKTSAYFVVEGTPNLKFGWELKAKQADFDQLRLEKENLLNVNTDTNMDYAGMLVEHIKNIKSEREVA